MQDITLYQNAIGDFDVYASNEKIITIFNNEMILSHLQNDNHSLKMELLDLDKVMDIPSSKVADLQHLAQLIAADLPSNAHEVGCNVYLNDDLVATTEY